MGRETLVKTIVWMIATYSLHVFTVCQSFYKDAQSLVIKSW